MDYETSCHTASLPMGDYLCGYRDELKFLGYCRECHQYANCWACPPFDFDPLEIMRRYGYVHLLGVRITPSEGLREVCSTPELSRKEGGRILSEVRVVLDRHLLLMERRHPGARVLFAGTCRICPEGACTRRQGKACRHPDRVRPSLESFGFDVGKTASRLLGIELQWSADGSFPSYYTLVSGVLSQERSLSLELMNWPG